MQVENGGLDAQIETISSLKDPVRLQLYRLVMAAREPVTRDQAAKTVGISRPLAAFHLDRLVEEGLLEPVFRRLTGRSGPGAGRPSKLYRRSSKQLYLTLPARQYELAARLLARAMTEQSATSTKDALARAAQEFGEQLGRSIRDSKKARRREAGLLRATEDLLRGYGFEPYWDPDDGSIRLHNCPFHALATEFRDLTCGMNLDLMEGLITGIGQLQLEARLEPRPGQCCVAFRTRRQTSS